MDLTTFCGGTLLALAVAWPITAAAQACEQAPRIPRHVIAEAMRAHGPYSLTSTTTAMVFGSEALLAIVRLRQREAPGATQFLIDHEDWFKAHQETAGVDYATLVSTLSTALAGSAGQVTVPRSGHCSGTTTGLASGRSSARPARSTPSSNCSVSTVAPHLTLPRTRRSVRTGC